MRAEHAKQTVERKELLLDRPFFNCADAPEGQFIRLNFYNLFWIFIITSVAGLIIETVISYPIDGIWKDRAGVIWGPFSPIYGAGAVMFTVLLNKCKNKPAFFIFAVSGLVGAGFELFAGWLMEYLYGMVAWDYSSQPFNIAGKTCLAIGMVWGAMGFGWMRFCLAPVVNLANMVPEGNIRIVLTALMGAFIGIDIIMTFVSTTFWFDRMAGVPVVTDAQTFFATYFPDSFMENKFQTISMYPELAG